MLTALFFGRLPRAVIDDLEFLELSADPVPAATPHPMVLLAEQVRVIPHKDAEGVVDGMRLSGIRRSSPFSEMGLKNGDVVHRANGRELDHTYEWDAVLTRWTAGETLLLDVTRRGEPQVIKAYLR